MRHDNLRHEDTFIDRFQSFIVRIRSILLEVSDPVINTSVNNLAKHSLRPRLILQSTNTRTSLHRNISTQARSRHSSEASSSASLHTKC